MDDDDYSWLCDYESDCPRPTYFGVTKKTNPKPKLKKVAEMSKELYEIKLGDEVSYGTKLAVNSQGQWVMEIKGNGSVIAVDKTCVEKVLPHTIAVQFDSNKTTYHYLAQSGKYNKGDFYIFDGQYGRAIVQIVDVDTKSTCATVEFKPLAKIKTE